MSARNSIPWLKFDVGRWRSSERVMCMSSLARGVYFELLCAAWENGGWLPNAPAILWKYARCLPAEWAEVQAEVLTMFTTTPGGRLENETLSAELADAKVRVEARSAAGRAGAEGRKACGGYGKRMANACDPQAVRNATATNNGDGNGNDNGNKDGDGEEARNLAKNAAAGPALVKPGTGTKEISPEVLELATAIDIDHRAAKKILHNCRSIEPSITAAEVAYLTTLKGGDNVKRPVALWISCLHEALTPGRLQAIRAQLEREEQQACEAEISRQQNEETNRSLVEKWKAEERLMEKAEAVLIAMDPDERNALLQEAGHELRKLSPSISERCTRGVIDGELARLAKKRLIASGRVPGDGEDAGRLGPSNVQAIDSERRAEVR